MKKPVPAESCKKLSVGNWFFVKVGPPIYSVFHYGLRHSTAYTSVLSHAAALGGAYLSIH